MQVLTTPEVEIPGRLMAGMEHSSCWKVLRQSRRVVKFRIRWERGKDDLQGRLGASEDLRPELASQQWA